MLFEPWYESLIGPENLENHLMNSVWTNRFKTQLFKTRSWKMRTFSWIKLTLVETRLKVAVWSFKTKTMVVIISSSNFTHIQAVILMVVQNRHFWTNFIGLREMSQFEKLSCKIARCWNFQLEMQIQTEINLIWWRYWTSLNLFETVSVSKLSTYILFANITAL